MPLFVHKIIAQVLKENNLPEGIVNLVIGSGKTIGEKLNNDKSIPLISSTGSCRMGRRIGEAVGKRLGKVILELGGNNAVIVMDDANLDMVVRSVLFGAVGTAGQRCTTTRRLIVHEKVFDKVVKDLINSYKQVTIGNPFDEGILMGPVVNKETVEIFSEALETIKKQGGEILYGGNILSGEKYKSGCYVEPTIVKAAPDMEIIKEETFAPILYIVSFKTLDSAITTPVRQKRFRC